MTWLAILKTPVLRVYIKLKLTSLRPEGASDSSKYPYFVALALSLKFLGVRSNLLLDSLGVNRFFYCSAKSYVQRSEPLRRIA